MEAQAQIIKDIIAPALKQLTPTNYSNNNDQLLQGQITMGINIQQLSTQGGSFTFSTTGYDVIEQTHTQGLFYNLQLSDFVQPVYFDVNQQLVDSLIDETFSQKKKQLVNSDKALQSMQKVVISMIKNNQITIGNFSQNCLTNANKYTHEGDISSIQYVQVPIQNKRYTNQDVYNKMPHPIRMKRKRRVIKQQALQLKSKQDILKQFQILADMFNMQSVESDQDNSYQKVLDVIGFQDISYDILWQQIIDKISVKEEEEEKRNNRNYQDKDLINDEFRETVNKVIKQHQQYEKQLYDDLVQQTLQDNVKTQPTSTQQQKQQKQQQQITETFKSIKIQTLKANPTTNRIQYRNAIEDESDLLNFYDVLPKQKFAMQFSYELDQFQKRSILHLEKKQSVFVCAHTSAGKTAVAEYGIALAIKHKRKVIYTSPIKALSNQKYRDFCQKFDSVGIVTGDITMNQQANCVIMTTEILANQLYKGADMIRDIQWVIFDEVHYINNPQRGVVWQETIIMLPQHIGIIMLSATVPNYMQFADWVGRTKRRMVYVMKTFHRPVPLQHSLYVFDKFHVIKEAGGGFLQDQYKDMLQQIRNLSLSHQEIRDQKKAEKKKKIQERGFWNNNNRQQALKKKTQGAINKFIKNVSQDDMKRHKDREASRMLIKLINDCNEKKLLPCVVFCFSKRKIQQLAENIYTNKLTTSQQSGEVLHFFNQALQNLKPEDRDLNQFRFLFEITRNGYAIHHGDLMPLAKQIVELLFSKGLIKVLLATETFAMGINMPTKTVIFHSTTKVDGPDGKMRVLNSSQYVQMSGRAGRRGLDQKGTVIIMVKDPQGLPQANTMKKMTDYPGEPLVSKFRVTYKTVLNLYSSKDINAQQMMRQSFYENYKFGSLNDNHQTIRALMREYDILSQFECPFNKLQTRLLIEQYMTSVDNNRELNSIQASYIEPNKIGLPRFGQVLDHANQLHKCVVLKIQKDKQRPIQILTVNQISTEFYITRKQMDQSQQPKKKKIVLQYQNSKGQKIQTGAVPDTKNRFHYYIRWIKAYELIDVYSQKITNQKNIVLCKQVFEDLARKLIDVPSKLVSYFKEQDLGLNKKEEFDKMVQSKCHNCEFKIKHTQQNLKRRKTKSDLQWLLKKVDKKQLSQLKDYTQMIKTLEQLQFLNKGFVLLKGKVAREIDIYLTQILLEGVLEPLKQSQIAALLSAFVNQFKPRIKPKDNQAEQPPHSPFHPTDSYTPALAYAIDRTYSIISKIIDIQSKHSILIDESRQQRIYNVINFYLVKPVYDWTQGDDFIDIADPQLVPQGTLIKTIMRLDILLRNLKSGCMIVGNTSLAQKVQKASEMIKRDIVFTQSLYLAQG